ncbi:MAG: zinc ribbon domain-containing protein, partial [Candidatus Kariarchaeaceae archaeon]
MTNYCWNCGYELQSNAIFCGNCGSKQDVVNRPLQTDMNLHKSQYSHYSRNYYTRPADYQFTISIFQRIFGTLKADPHIIEEIKEREELKHEAIGIFLITALASGLINLLSDYLIDDEISDLSISNSISTIVFNLTFIISIIYVAKTLAGQVKAQQDDIFRVLSYSNIIYIFFVLPNLI